MMTKEKKKYRPLRDITCTKRMSLLWAKTGKTAVSLRSVSLTSLDCLANLEELVRLIELNHSIQLPRVDLLGDGKNVCSAVKGFCGRILEPFVFHEWKSVLRRYGIRIRISVAASLFLFRKVVPAGEKPDVLRYMTKMSTPQDPPSSDFMEHVRRETCKMFPVGWDRGHWDRNVAGFTLPTTACNESPRLGGGARGAYHRGKFVINRDSCLENPDISDTVHPMVIWAGKWRLVSVASATRTLLRPLHKTIYDYISEKEWLLRGEADASRFADFTREEGEVFVSGDYESATDNLNIHVSEAVLKVILEKSRHIPPGQHDAAMRSLRSTLRIPPSLESVMGLKDDDSVEMKQARGQLMGNLLSFPLLCIINYLTFRYFVPRDVPVKVNGDDIVFRSTLEEYRNWSDGVQVSGLTLSKGKTIIAWSIFSLNSSFFRAPQGGGGPVLLPFIRSTCLFTRAEDPHQVRGRLKSVCVSYKGKSRDRVHAVLLTHARSVLGRMQGSIRRRLGASVSNRALKLAWILDREKFYSSFCTQSGPSPEPPLPLRRMNGGVIPPGWWRARVHSPVDETRFFQDMCEESWKSDPCGDIESRDAWWERVRAGTLRYHFPSPISRRARLLGMTSLRADRYLASFRWPKREEIVTAWLPVRSGPLKFNDSEGRVPLSCLSPSERFGAVWDREDWGTCLAPPCS